MFEIYLKSVTYLLGEYINKWRNSRLGIIRQDVKNEWKTG